LIQGKFGEGLVRPRKRGSLVKKKERHVQWERLLIRTPKNKAKRFDHKRLVVPFPKPIGAIAGKKERGVR